jgi:hypothetical protein
MERGFLRVVAFCCTVATSGVASAQPCDRASPTITGQNVKCAGILIPTVQANRALACMRFDLPQCLERKDAVSRLCEIDKSALDTLLKMERQRVKSLLVVPKERVVSGWLGESVAFGLGVAVAALTAYAWIEARD